MDFNKFLQSGVFKAVLLIIAVALLVMAVFQIGMMVGFRKASFSYKWGENYHRNFGGPQDGFFREMEMPGKDFLPGHGIFGQIIKIEGSNLIIKDQDGTEQSVMAKDKCSIRKFRDDVKFSDLKVDDQIVVIGAPSSTGQIEADFIRVLPPPPQAPQAKNPATSTPVK